MNFCYIDYDINDQAKWLLVLEEFWSTVELAFNVSSEISLIETSVLGLNVSEHPREQLGKNPEPKLN